MRILIICIHAPVCFGRYMRDAFLRLGADVRSIGLAGGSQIWNLKLAPDKAWIPDGSLQTVWPDWKPDLILWAMQPVDEIQRLYPDIPQVLQSVDNHVLSWRHPGIAHYFLAHLHGQEMPATGENITWLPCAYDPVFHNPSPIPWSQRRHDVSLVGVMYPHRAALIEALRSCGIKVFADLGPVYEEYREIYHQTRISLCPSARSDVAQRVFETAAMRCLILTDPCPDLPHLKADGIAVYTDVPTAVNAVRQLLANPKLAESVIERSYNWVKPHTWDARARTIIAWYENRS
jgi:hypothetical protein